MKKYILAVALVLSFWFDPVFAQKPIGVGQWRTHLAYNNVVSIAETPGLLYVAAERSFYGFELNTGEIELYSKVNGFSDVEVSRLAYYDKMDLLFIAYENANIDLLVDGNIINIPEVLRESIVGVKKINDVYFYDGTAYVSTNFGVLQVDLTRHEIKGDFRRIGPMGLSGQITPVSAVCILDGKIYATTPDGVISADLNSNLSDASSWSLELGAIMTGTSGRMINFNGKIYADVDSVVRVYDGNTWGYFNGPNQATTVSMDVNHDRLVIGQHGGIYVIETNGNQRMQQVNEINYAVYDFQGNIWTGGFGTGLIKIDPNGVFGYVQPNGPAGISSFGIYQFNKDMWVMAGGVTDNWGPAFNNNGIYLYHDGLWSDYRKDKPQLKNMRDFIVMDANVQTGDFWFGTQGFGLAHVRNGQVQAIYDEKNSKLQRTTGGFLNTPGVAIDKDNNVWVTNYNAEGNLNSLCVRKANGEWKSFVLPTDQPGKLLIDGFGQKWMTVPNNTGEGLVVFFDEDGIDGNVRRTRVLTTGIKNGDLPSNRVNAMVLDEDGEVWVGTDEGLTIFYNPSNVFEGGENADAQRIIIDDGKDVGYLLGSEVINDMALDGANRKWIATNNGVWLVESDGSKVLKHFTIKNSPLLSNRVTAVGIDQITGEVYFGTDKGIISYRGDATAAGDKHTDVVVFPNPVREDYSGVITITGLPNNATVKITDVAGRMVYEMISDGGTAVWNGLSFNGQRPSTGVYLIFTANEEDKDALVSKLLIVNK